MNTLLIIILSIVSVVIFLLLLGFFCSWLDTPTENYTPDTREIKPTKNYILMKGLI